MASSTSGRQATLGTLTVSARGPVYAARAVALSCFITLLAASQVAVAQQRPAAVEVAPVTVQKIRETRSILGQLVVPVESEIATRTAGVIDQVNYLVGDTVERGEELVLLDTTLLEIEERSAKAAVDVANAEIAVAEARLKQAEIAFSRQERLQSSGAFSRSRFEDLQQEMRTAAAELARARAAAGNARVAQERVAYQLRHSVITSAVGGVVIRRWAQPGDYISVGDTVATILDVSQLEIAADVPSNLVPGLMTQPGQPPVQVMVRASSGAAFRASVRAIVPVEQLSTQTRQVRFTADFAELDPSLVASGQSVTLELPAGPERDVLAVPKDALVQAIDSWIVFAVVDGIAERRPIKIGSQSGGYVEVSEGVSADDVVVIRGNERLRPGQPVTTESESASEQPRPARS